MALPEPDQLSSRECSRDQYYNSFDFACTLPSWMAAIPLNQRQICKDLYGKGTREKKLYQLFQRHRADERFEDLEALHASKFGLAGTFGVGHHAQNVSAWVADTGNIVQ